MKKILIVSFAMICAGIATVAIAAPPDKMDLWHCGCVLDSFNEFGQSSSVRLKYSNLSVRGKGKGHGDIGGATGHDDPETCTYVSDGTHAAAGDVVEVEFDRWYSDYEATDLSIFVENCVSTTNPFCPSLGEPCGS